MQSPATMCDRCVRAVCALRHRLERHSAAVILNLHKDKRRGLAFTQRAISVGGGVCIKLNISNHQVIIKCYISIVIYATKSSCKLN